MLFSADRQNQIYATSQITDLNKKLYSAIRGKINESSSELRVKAGTVYKGVEMVPSVLTGPAQDG